MLTWGFEGEAQRLAAREKRRAIRRAAYGTGNDDSSLVAMSDSSSADEYDDYLDSLGGADDDEAANEQAGERALAFFVDHARTINRPANESSSTGNPTGDRLDGKLTELTGGPAGPPLLFPAQQLSRQLQRRTRAAARTQALRRDALELLARAEGDFSEGISSAEAEHLEKKLRAFAQTAAAADDDATAAAAAEEEEKAADGGIEGRIDELKREMVALRRTTVAAMRELKEQIAEMRGTAQPAQPAA